MSYETPILTAGGASNQTIREAVTTPRHDVGTRAQTSDGRVFYYSRTSDSNVLAAGQLVMSEVIIANHANIAVSSAAAVGATSVAVTLGGSESLVKDAYQGGYLVVNDVDGEGRTYRIAGNAATSSTTAATPTSGTKNASAAARAKKANSKKGESMATPLSLADSAAEGAPDMADLSTAPLQIATIAKPAEEEKPKDPNALDPLGAGETRV